MACCALTYDIRLIGYHGNDVIWEQWLADDDNTRRGDEVCLAGELTNKTLSAVLLKKINCASVTTFCVRLTQ